MLFRVRRGGGSGTGLEWRVGLFAVGATLGLAGIRLEERWLTGAAIVVLAAGALVQLLPRPQDPDSRGETDGEG